MKFKLFPFQQEDVEKLKGWDYRGLVGNEVGLGKTATALHCKKETGGLCIVVCPANLKRNWKREAWRFFRIHADILEGRTPVKLKRYRRTEMLIINFEILETWVPYLRDLKPKMIIIDEAQRIVGLHTKQSKQTTRLCSGVPHVLELTGTPIVNNHWDLYPLLHILDPERFDSGFSFGMEFCVPAEANGKLVFSGAIGGKKLHRILTKDYLIRRTKEEVLKDLPPLTRTILPLDIPRKEYDKAHDDFLRWLSSYDIAAADRASRNERLTKFGYLKRLAVREKLPICLGWIDDFLKDTDGKLIVGALSRNKWPNTIQVLEARYSNSVSVHGGKTPLQKQSAVDQFQKDDKTRLIFLQLKSGGTGLNLQGRKRSMCLLELPWHPADVGQFVGRGHRIGTTDPVQCWFLLAANTIEEKICKIIQRKSKICDNTIDGKPITANSLNLMDELTIAMQAKALAKRKRP